MELLQGSHTATTTAMCWAAAQGDLDLMHRVRAHGADINAGDYDKRTPLHIAVSDSQVDAVELLLQWGANAEAVDRWGRSPIDCALDNQNPRILQLLHLPQKFHKNVGPKVYSRTSPAPSDRYSGSLEMNLRSFFHAIKEGNTDKIKRAWLDGVQLDVRDHKGHTSLHLAVEHGQVAVVELLLSAGVDVHVVDQSGRTPMAVAMDKSMTAIVELLRQYENQAISTTKMEATDDQHITQAFRAAKSGDITQLRALVPSRVHVDVQDYDLRTLLHIASAEGQLEVAQYLVDCGVQVNLLDRWGTSALSEAIDFAHNEVAKLLAANHASINGNNAILPTDQIDSNTLYSALEFSLRAVTRDRWTMGQVFCPTTDGTSDTCVLVAHSVWHKHARSSTLAATSSLHSHRYTFSSANQHSSGNTPLASDPLQAFRRAASSFLVDPGQGHVGQVYSTQQPEWLSLPSTTQSHYFLLPLARRAALQTSFSAPMILNMSAIAVLSWYTTEELTEDPSEVRRVQRLLRSVTTLAGLKQQLTSVSNNFAEVPRWQYCRLLDNAITANGELIDTTSSKEDMVVSDTTELALEWGLWDFVHSLAVSMSSEDHSAAVPLLRSLTRLLENKDFQTPFYTEWKVWDPAYILRSCQGRIRTRQELLVHLQYYVHYLHAVSPPEGTIFLDVSKLVATVDKIADPKGMESDEDMSSGNSSPRDVSKKETEPQSSPKETTDCVLCKYNVPGHMHPGKQIQVPANATPNPTKQNVQSSGLSYFNREDAPLSPIFLEIHELQAQLGLEYDKFHKRSTLLEHYTNDIEGSVFTSSEIYDSIGAAHDTKATSKASSMTRQRLTEVLNGIVQDTASMLTLEQLYSIHKCLLPETSCQAGVTRVESAVGYASARIYRVFLPVAEIEKALEHCLRVVNDEQVWRKRPLLRAYYAFAVLVFYIHPFHDGNGRCARLVGNLLAKKAGYPSILRASDKTIQVGEFLQKAVATIDRAHNSRRYSRQSRVLSTRKENTSMWF